MNIKAYFRATENLKTENSKPKQEVNEINKKMQHFEHSLRSNNIEIQDVPDRPNENLLSVLTDIGKFLSFNVQSNLIDTVFRVPTQTENKAKNIV